MELEQSPGQGTPESHQGKADETPAAADNGRAADDQPPAENPSADRDESKPKKVRRGPGRNLPIAIGVGVTLGAIVLLAVYLVQWVFLAVMAVFLGIAVRELTGSLAGRGIRVPLVPLAAGGLAMLVLPYTSGPIGLLVAFGLTVLALLIWRMPAGSQDYVRDTTASIFTAVYIPFLAGFAALMLASTDGPDRIITFIALTVSSDIGGFFVGAFLGRHKMAAGISPKKTWEGFAGSALACMLVGGLLLPLLLNGEIWHGIVLGAAVVCSATLGDLIESMIKRDLGVKDMGRLLPEHGGAMDRLDSLLATAPVVWLGLQLFVPPS
jgi:phosphatidate cytidylyltransferase